MKIAVLGYGNLGKSVEKYALETGQEVVGIFSRRKVESGLGSRAYRLESFPRFEADVAALCFGSAEDMTGLAPLIAMQCNTVDAYDNHSEMKGFHSLMDAAAKSTNHVALLGCGWDTGVMSAIRGLCCLLGETQGTFWGRGISQGHSNALRTVDGVLDAVQFTLPNDKMKTKEGLNQPSEKRHRRVCYLVTEKGADKAKIIDNIIDMKGYFAGYETEINFVDQAVLDKLKKDTSHRGEVVCFGSGLAASFKLKLKDNCYTTAKIMVEYAKAALSLADKKLYGAYTAMDIAPSEFLGDKTWKYV